MRIMFYLYTFVKIHRSLKTNSESVVVQKSKMSIYILNGGNASLTLLKLFWTQTELHVGAPGSTSISQLYINILKPVWDFLFLKVTGFEL